MAAQIYNWCDLDTIEQSTLLERPALIADGAISASVAAILKQVQKGGDVALRKLTLKFDGVELDAFRVSDAEVSAAESALDIETIAAIDVAIANVRRFHEPQLPEPYSVEIAAGVRCERVSHAIDSVGLYVPAGSAPLPSAAIMLGVPAAIAGCPTRIMCTPPRSDGAADAAIVVAATKAGIDEIYKIGGAQAIAAMAYGTETVPKVLKIFGPGNSWVTCAKTLVSAAPGGTTIDMPAGPSEVMVIADSGAHAELVAADLLSQAEHGADSQVILVTTNTALAEQVQRSLEQQLADLPRAEIARECLQHSRIIVVESIENAIELSNRYAPEHLILQLENAADLVAGIRNAGSVFVGQWAPESVGDYCSGTNHVLPTCGYARNFSGLGVEQFLRHMTVQELTRDGLASLADTVMTLAKHEGLDAHALAVSRRLEAVT